MEIFLYRLFFIIKIKKADLPPFLFLIE